MNVVDSKNGKTIPKQGVRRVILFKLIAFLFPFFVLFLLELILRLFNYGSSFSLFEETPDNRDFLVMSRDASEKYFIARSNATQGNSEIFKKIKDDNTIRIFVLGESTTIGYPYLHNGSFHRWLQYRLNNSETNKNFEIINLSLTAVNSYTVLGFGREIIKYQPDAVLIYTGHNEYYGALGVGSTSYIGSSPYLVRFFLKLRELRFVQLLTSGYLKITELFSGSQIDQRENLMKRMAAQQEIPIQSDLYLAGINQFKVNMEDLLKLFSKKHVPVFLSTLVSNEKDLKPFISKHADEMRVQSFKSLFAKGLEFLQKSDSGQAFEQFRKAAQVDSTYALSYYHLGSIAYAQHRYDEANKYFLKAKDLDALRFRAPEAINEAIKKLSTKYSNVTLVDAQAIYRSNSPHGVIGDELLLEHVHPNLLGYALISEAFYQALKRKEIIRISKELSFDELLTRMPVTKVDSLKGLYEVMILKTGWPFNEKLPPDTAKNKSYEEKLAGGLAVYQYKWGDAMNQLYLHYVKNKNYTNALKVTEAFALEYPYDPRFTERAGMLSLTMNDNESAVYFLKKAFALQASFGIAKTLFVTLLKMDNPQEAQPFLNFAVNHNDGSVNLAPMVNLVNEIIALKAAALKDSNNVNLLNNISRNYLMIGNIETATLYVKKVLKKDKGNKEALELLTKINQG